MYFSYHQYLEMKFTTIESVVLQHSWNNSLIGEVDQLDQTKSHAYSCNDQGDGLMCDHISRPMS